MGKIFFDDFSQMKPYLGSAFESINILTLESYLRNSLSHIANITGEDYLNKLLDDYDGAGLSAEDEALVMKIRKPLVNMCFKMYANGGTLMITDSGIFAQESETTKRPHAWQIRDLKKQCMADYADGMKELFDFIYENRENYTDIIACEEWLFLINRPIWKYKQWFYNGRRIANWNTHFALLPEMTMVWDDLAPIISQALWEEINGVVTGYVGDNAAIYALLPYIQRYVAHATVSRAAESLPITISDTGLILDEVAATATNDAVKKNANGNALAKQSGAEAEKAMGRLIKFLNSTADADTYVGYYEAFLMNPTAPVVLNKKGDKIIFM